MGAGHTGATACNVSIVGTGALNKVKSAKVSCTTTDAYWKKRNGGKVVVYAGKPLYNLYKAQPANWKGEMRPTQGCFAWHARLMICILKDIWGLRCGGASLPDLCQHVPIDVTTSVQASS